MITVDEKPLKALVIAYECSPARSHTPGSAWQVLRRLAEWHDLWVITEATQYQTEVETYLAGHPELAERLHFTFIPRDLVRRGRGDRPVLPIRELASYKRWHKRAFAVASALHARFDYDLVHLLRGDSFREPGYCWKLPIPFVWGPTGGRTTVPWRLLRVAGLRGSLLHALRSVITAAQFRFSPRVRAAARRASCLIAQTSFDQRKFREIHHVDAILAHEQAAEPSVYVQHQYSGQRPLAVAWIGRCIALKGLPILLKAMQDPALRGRMVLHVAGDGAYRRKWQEQAVHMGIAEEIKWHGWLGQDKTAELMRGSDVLAFTSLLEATSTTVMQALSIGLPVICLKHCGFGDVVDESCGIAIQLGSYRSVVRSFSEALRSLLQEPTRVERWSRGAWEKAQQHSWDRLASVLSDAYEKVVFGQQSRNRLVKENACSDAGLRSLQNLGERE